MEIRKLRVILLILVGFTFWCILRLTDFVEHLDPTDVHDIVRKQIYQTEASTSISPNDPRGQEKWPFIVGKRQDIKFNYSVEPGTGQRRIPARFWIASPQDDDLRFLRLPKKEKCDEDIKLVILVKSSMIHTEQRKTIRRTWGSIKNVDNYKIRVVYLLGQPSNNFDSRMMQEIENEAAEYDDIVIGNFVDSYLNVTKKSLMGLKYVHQFCRNVEVVLSADDDIFLNVTGLVLKQFLKEHRPMPKTLQCGLRTVKFAKVKRNGKWSIEYKKYDRSYFPPYCLGPCFLMSVDVALDIYEMSSLTPTDISIDDVVITGILREKIGVHLSSMQKGLCAHLANPDHVIEKLIQAWNAKVTWQKII